MGFTSDVRFPSRLMWLLLALPLALAGACGPAAAPDGGATTQVSTAERDEHSYAEPEKVTISALALDLAVDFDTKTITGLATYTLEWKDATARQLVLDSRDLTITDVEGDDASGRWQRLAYTVADADDILGSRFAIDAPVRNTHVRVTYRTSPSASGLQWLDPAMTGGRRLPFMFSQSQQIHARSWVPLQDTPRVRYTYTAHVTSRPDVMVLMSADNDTNAPRDGDYSFTMPQRIPSYLMAIAAGDLVFKPISGRSGVWAEPAMADRAVREFEDTERMIATAESLYGPYRWERYDILVLPPSFPYGGMENPRLTFATPTVIVGDKSLVSLIAHELAHSWSGNLVTFSSARDAWLNEGITTYVDHRLVEALYGREAADMERVIERNALRDDYATLPPALQVLATKPGDLPNPDGSSGSTVYAKGAWFMEFLEQRVGRADFDAFLRGYFDHFAFQSISSGQFAAYARASLLARFPDKVSAAEFDEWLHEPGIPANAPETTAVGFSAVDAARDAWLGGADLPAPARTRSWATQQWVHFLAGLPERLTAAQLSELDDAYRFTGTPNGEIAQRWYPLAVRGGYARAHDAMAAFLVANGRRKLIMPTYNALVETAAGLSDARAIFGKAQTGYHPITTGSVRQVIDGAKPSR